MNDSTPKILKRKFRLHSWEVDKKGRARPDILFSFMLDSAWAHASSSEFSYEALREDGQLWVLSRFLAMFHEVPRWDDELTVETWGKGTDKLFALRDYAVYNESGAKVISATSAWLVIDRKTSRIQRIDLLNSNFPFQLDKHEFDIKLAKIEERETARTDFEHIVTFSDIDVNHHVNSARYLSWVLDSTSKEVLEEYDLNTVEINFLAEAQLGEKVYVTASAGGPPVYSEVVREKDGAQLCRAIIGWGRQRGG